MKSLDPFFKQKNPDHSKTDPKEKSHQSWNEKGNVNIPFSTASTSTRSK